MGAAVPAGRPPDGRVRAVARRGRDHALEPARGAARGPRAALPHPRLPGRLPAHRAPVDRARAARRRGPRASSAPTRSSWAWTSGGSTWRSWPATRARSRRPGSRWAGPAAGATSSVAILVASPAPVDQYVIHHPEFLLGGSPRRRALDPDNLHVLLAHLRARDVRAAVRARRAVRPGPADDLLAFLGEGGHGPAGGRRPLVLELGELPGLGGLAAHGRARRTS